MSKFVIENVKHALVFGANRGIGLAIAKTLIKVNPLITLYLPYRQTSENSHIELLKEKYPGRVHIFTLSNIEESNFSIVTNFLESNKVKLDLIINAIGFLHTDFISPEKSLRSFSMENFLQMIQINAGITPLIAKCFSKFMQKKRMSAFVTISAKVGSISDNKMGGWYSYRASKAALNMLIKNISIEWKRSIPQCLVLSIHPGTTKTDLSKPFIKNTPYQLHEPEETAQNILTILNHKSIDHSGKFYSWNGEEIPW